MMALLDGDMIIYRAALVAEPALIDWDGDGQFMHTAHSLKDAKDCADGLLRTWTEGARCKEYRICLTDRSRPKWRASLYPEYCAGRGPKPALHDEIHDYLADREAAVEFPGLEGDDVIGRILTAFPDECVCVSLDKDMITVPGLHYNPSDCSLVSISSTLAEFNTFVQALTGDRVDNYHGCYGVGLAKALKHLGPIYEDEILSPSNDYTVNLWETVKFLFETSYALHPEHYKHTPDYDALLCVRLAHILHVDDYDPEGQRIRLWTPPGSEEIWTPIPKQTAASER